MDIWTELTFLSACRCSAEFCYRCGKPRCTCPVAGPAANGANDLVGRVGDRAHDVGAARQRLIVDHECNHRSWESRRGPHLCEVCYEVMARFIYECRVCNLMACRRCRYT